MYALDLLEEWWTDRWRNTGGGMEADAESAPIDYLRRYELEQGVRFVMVPND